MFLFDPNNPLKFPDTKNANKKVKAAKTKTIIDEVDRLVADTSQGSLYITVKALDDDVYGRIKLNTDITTEDI